MEEQRQNTESGDRGLGHMLAFGGYIFLFVGLVFLCVSLGMFLSEKKEAKAYTETQGVITGFNQSGYPYVSYTVQGTTYEQRSNYSSSSMRVGREITVRYDPEDPAKIVASGAVKRMISNIFAGVSGLLLLVGGGWVWLIWKKFLPKDDNPWDDPVS